MNYKAFKKSMVAFGAGMALWYAAGLSGYETTPGRVVSDAVKIGVLESLVQDSGDTSTIPGMAGKMLTYSGIIGAGLSLANVRKKKKQSEDKK